MMFPTEIFGQVVVVHSAEELGKDQVEHFEEFLHSLDRPQVVLDLDPTESFDNAGLTCLLDAQDYLRESGGDLKVCTKNHINRKILEMTRLDQQIDVYQNVIDAVKSFA